MSRRRAGHRRAVAALIALLLATLAPMTPAARAAEETGPKEPVELPVQPGVENTFDPVRAQPPADITIGEAGGGASPDLGQPRVEPPADIAPDSKTDVADLRGEHHAITANPDGTYTATITGERQHYQDPEGDWQKIDTDLVADASDGFSLRTKANDRVVRIAERPADGRVAVLEANGHTIALIVAGVQRGTLDAAADTVTFAAADPKGAALVLEPTPEGIEFSFALTTREAARSHDIVLDPDGLAVSLDRDGRSLLLRDEAGTIVAVVTAPITFDAAGVVADDGSTTVELDPPDKPIVDPAPAATPSPAPSEVPPEPTASPSATPGEPSASPSDGIEPSPTAVPSDLPVDPASPSASVDPTPDPSPSPSPSPTPTPTPSPTPTAAPAEPSAQPVAPSDDGTVTVRYQIADAWLDDPTRVYPVVLDPVIQGDGSGTYDCDAAANATTAFDDWVGQFNNPLCSSHMAIGTDDDASAYGFQRGLFWFKGIELGSGTWADDGQQITEATFSLYKDEGAARSIRTTLITGKGWTTPADWYDQQGQGGNNSIRYLCADAIATNCTAGTALFMPAVTTPAGDGWVNQDVSALVRRWYTKRGEDWLPNLGLMTRFSTETQAENIFHNSRYPTTSLRPKLTITYVAPHVGFDFDTTTLGSTFAPATMVKGSTVRLPVRVHNTGSSLPFNRWVSGSTDYWFLGYRWFDAKGKLVKQAGFTPSGAENLPADVAPFGYSAYLPLDVAVPPLAGQYTLRVDLGHDVDGARLWASDWTKASKYLARNKAANTTPEDVRWVGSSIIERAEFPIAVVAGGGTAIGETKTIDLADGTNVGINLWSRNLAISADAGIGFRDLGTEVGLSYHYNSADKGTCDLVLLACGWATTYDERFAWSAGELTYRDPEGNRYLVDANAAGQLVSAAPVRIERPRVTVFDENTLAWSTGTPTYIPAAAYSGSNGLSVGATASGVSSDFRPIELSDYPFVSFATKAPTTGKSALGFKIHDAADGSDTWFFYANGTTTTWAVSGQLSKWTGNHVITANFYHYQQLDLFADVRAALPDSSFDLTITAIDIRGPGTGSGVSYFDALRFEGRRYVAMAGTIPANTTCGGTCTSAHVESIIDASSPGGTSALRVWSPSSPGIATAPTTAHTFQITNHEYATWSWRKQGGATIALGFYLVDKRDPSINGWLYYYAGEEPTALGTEGTRLKVSDTLPDRWTTVTRNLADDARQILGIYDDTPESSPATPGSGPIPDPLERTKYQFIAWDGSHAMFDMYSQSSIPDPIGDEYGDLTGDDYVVTYRGGSTHRFDGLGRLVGIEDLDGNRTAVGWTYDSSTRTSKLASITAPANGLPRTGGTANRRITVTVTGNPEVIRFSEVLDGVTGRYAEFVTNAANDLVTVIPGRRSAACAASGPTGCRKLGYDASHRPTLLRDPRSNGSDDQALAIGWSGNDPLTLTRSGGGVLLRILNYDPGGAPTGQRRVRWQDADGTATGVNGYARHTDLSPNGSVLTEWAPSACSSANCVGGGAATNKEATFTADGVDQTTSETRYRLAGSGAAVTTRRGTLAGARVDNYADPITASLTAWTQTPDQAAASSSSTPGDAGFLSTEFSYTGSGDIATQSTVHANPAGGDPRRTVQTRYDDEGHPVQVDDNRFFVNPGFEAGSAGWTVNATTIDGTTTTHDPSSFRSLKLNPGGSAVQAAQLLPGQTVRFQAWVKSSSGTLTAALRYWDLNSASWELLPGGTITSTASAWTQLSYDITMSLPAGATDGQLRIGFSASGTSWVDDVALMTSYVFNAYHPDGRPDASRDVLGRRTMWTYAASVAHPAIFPTGTVRNDVPSVSDPTIEDVTSSTTYDAWGRALVATDPDGVTSTSVYGANRTDVMSVLDGLGAATDYTWDEIGQRRTVETPLGFTTSTSYDWFGNALDVTTPDATTTHQVIDPVGRVTDRYLDWLSPGTVVTGTRNIRTQLVLDAYGRTTSRVEDVGGIAATTTTTYDQFSNLVSGTVYQDGTSSGPRTITSHFDPAGNAAGQAGPIAPTAGTAPLCPSSGSLRCNAVSVIDQNGQVTKTTDAYGTVTTFLYDLAGRAIREVRNDKTSPTDYNTEDIKSISVYDAAGRLVASIDPLGRTATMNYDPLDRLTVVTQADSSYVETRYTAGGRVSLTTRPTAAGTAVGAVTWTAQRYDGAGRLVTTLADYDISGAAQHQLDPFEDGEQSGWSTADALPFIVGGATLSDFFCGCLQHTGGHGANIAVGATANQGAGWALSGTFQPGHTYRARIWTRYGTGGASVRLYLGQSSTATMYGVSGTVALTGSWQSIDATWTVPGSTPLSGVYLALRTETATAADIRIDDAAVWDEASPARNTPSITAYDADGRVTASVLPGGAPGDDPHVTTTTYDAMARPTQVMVNHVGFASQTLDRNLDTDYAYDALGRQTSMTAPSVDGSAPRVVTTTVLDRLGRTSATIANDVATVVGSSTDDVTARFTWNDRGELMASCAPERVLTSGDGCATPGSGSAGAWRYTYDANGQVLTETPPTRAASPAIAVRTNTYDTASGGARLVTSVENNGTTARRTDLVFDPLSRVTTSTTYAGTGTTTPKLRTTTTFDAGSQTTNVLYSEHDGSTWPVSDQLAFAYDGRGRLSTLTRTSVDPDLVLTAATYNADDTVATRTDVAGTLGTSTFGYDRRGRLISAASPIFTGSATFGWRLDDLAATRSWPATGGAISANFAYDAAKRPTTLDVVRNSTTIATFGRAYDRRGSVTSESQTVTGISGHAGLGTQTFAYDPLQRVTGAAGLSGEVRTYAYDASSNRTSETQNGVTTLYTFDRTDELRSRKVGSDSVRTASYDAFGNLVSLPIEAGGGSATALTYDLADHLKSIDGPSEPVVSFTIDALGRSKTRQVGAGTAETLNYAGTSDAITRLGGGSIPVDAALDPAGTRLATRQSAGSPSFLLPDLHGNVAAIWSQATSAYGDVFRYDPWGETIAQHTTGAARTPWRFQGRMVEGEPGDAELYDFGFRSYAADTGSFASLDDYAGGAQDPITLNRFLYAHANPATLIDPDGHRPLEGDTTNEGMSAVTIWHQNQQQAAAKAKKAAKSSSADAGHAKRPAVMVKGDSWWAGTQVPAPGGGFDPLGALGDVAGGIGGIAGGAATAAWDFGSGVVIGTVDIAACAVPIDGFGCSPASLANDLATDWDRTTTDIAHGAAEGIGEIRGDLLSGDPYRVAKAVTGVFLFVGTIGAAKAPGKAPSRATTCLHSFAAATVVRSASGAAMPIAEVEVGDEVAARDPDDGSAAAYAVTATFQHDDTVTGTLVIDGEPIVTTPGHRFLTDEGWVEAAALRPGDEVITLDGGTGVVWSLDWSGGARTMHDLTVATVHTFAVGSGGWVVHNCDRPGWQSGIRDKVFEKGIDPDGIGRCQHCGVEIQRSKWDADHYPTPWREIKNIFPDATRNEYRILYNDVDNVVPSCQTCNRGWRRDE
jgi:RHS repeat-associated protein